MSSLSDAATGGADVRVERRGATAHILIDRPQVANALAPATTAALADAFVQAELDPAVRVIVVRGAGDRAFCAGIDLGARTGAFVHPMKRQARNLHEVILETEKPTIAAVNGGGINRDGRVVREFGFLRADHG